MNPNQWEQDRTWLRSAIKNGKIAQATRKELIKHLIHLANEPDPVKYDVENETKRFVQIVTLLLQGIQSQRAIFWSRIAICIAALSAIPAIVSAFAMFHPASVNHATLPKVQTPTQSVPKVP